MLKKVEETKPYTMTEEAEEAVAPKKKRSFSGLLRVLRGFGQGLFMIAILAGSIVVMNKLVDSKPPTKGRPAFKSAYTVDLFTAVQANNKPTFVSYGQVVAARTVDLRALVSGEIVSVSPNLRSGETIAKGDTLVEIDPFNYRGALAEAQANLLEARSRVTENEARIALEESKFESLKEQLAFAEADLTRITKLRKRGQSTEQQREARQLVVSQRNQALSISQDTVTIEQARLSQLQASLQRLQWKVEQAQRNLDSTKLVAPFNGIVRNAAAEVGRVVNASDVVVSLYEAGSLETRFTLTDEQYGRLQTAQDGLIDRAVDVTWTVGGKNYTWTGTVDRLGADITSSRGGVEVYAQVQNTDNAVTLRPGAFVEVTVPDVTFADSFKIPDTAVYGSDTVYVAVDGKLEERKVEIAAYDGETVIISSGLKVADQILTTRITEVSSGLNVRTEVEANKPRPQNGDAKEASAASRGRPTREEMQKIFKANNITGSEFRALPQDQRRKMVREWRQANPAPAPKTGG